MADQKLIDEVGKYIDKYYEPAKDDIKMDKEMLSIFDKITKFREKRAREKVLEKEQIQEGLWRKESCHCYYLCDTNHVLSSEYSEVVVVEADADAVDYKLISVCHK